MESSRRSSALPAVLGWLALALILSAGGCSRKTAAPLTTPARQPASVPTEQRWIIGSVLRDAVNLAVFAAGATHWTALPANGVEVRENAGSEPGQSYDATIQLPGGGEAVRCVLPIKATVWSPSLYVPALRAVFDRLKLSPPAGNDAAGALADSDLLRALSNPLTAEIERQNQKLSAWLQDHPLDARAHEQAALLLGTLAMRENSGLYWNPRALCNRAAAHLAFARVLRPNVSTCGEVADLLIGVIIDTKADCQKRIAALQAQVPAHPELGAWAMAAALRNTRDYRLLPNPDGATFLERVELFRALAEAISTEQAIKRMPNLQPTTAPDWERIVLQGGYGVGAGHQFAMPSTGLEWNDAMQIFPALRTARAPAQLAMIFNPVPGDTVQAGEDGRPRLRVIDQGTWAQFFQRHVLQSADETYHFLAKIWGVPEMAKSFRVQVGPLLKRLTLYPLCLDFLGKEDGEALYAPAADLLNQHPEWVSDQAWARVVKVVPAQYAKGGSWATVSRNWFSPGVPTGTVYGFDGRMIGDSVLPTPVAADLQHLYAIAPLKYSVAWIYVSAAAPHHHPTFEQYQQAMGPLLAYYLPAISGEASLVQNDPAKYGAALNEAAALNPGYYLTLGRYYRTHRMEIEAAQAYQAAIDQGADQVAVANDCRWLVDYYYDHGQRERAMSIAQQAAEVYSFRGLETWARLLERMERIPEAESYYNKIYERYQDAKPLNAFYARQATAHPEYADKMKAAEDQIFPQGMEEVTLAKLTDKPTKGVIVRGENELSRQAGLKPDAIIVGLDGKRVRDMNQYSYVRGLTTSPDLTLLVYQDGKYQEIHANIPGRMFNLVFATWP